MHCTAIIADLVASREATPKQRSRQQETLLQTLHVLNDTLGSALVRPALLTAGDEVQALLSEPPNVVQVIQSLEDALLPHATLKRGFAFGVGYGELSTALDSGASVEHLDGPCFHLARAALDEARKAKIWARFAGFEETANIALNGLFDLMGAVREGWTETQAAHTVELRHLGKRIEVARERGVSPSVVTESLQAAHFESVQRGESAAVQILSRLMRVDRLES